VLASRLEVCHVGGDLVGAAEGNALFVVYFRSETDVALSAVGKNLTGTVVIYTHKSEALIVNLHG